MSFPFPREPGGVPEILGSIFENLPSMVFVKDAALLRFVTVNRAAEELLGFSREELIGKSDHDFFPADQADGFTARDRAVLMSGREVDIAEETILTRHRGVRVLHTKKVPLLGADGAPKFLLGISEDITELKDVERRLRESEHQLRRLLEAIPDLIFRIDRGGRFLSFVPARGMRTLAPESEFIGKTFADVMPPELSRMAGDAFERALSSGEAQVIEYDLVEGGKRRYYEARIVPVGTDDFISIVEPGARKYNRDSVGKLVSRAGDTLNPAPIRVPAIEGDYEVVYGIQPGGRLIARRPISVTRAAASVDAPQSAKLGEDIPVTSSGDGFAGDRVVITPADTPDLKMWGVGVNYGFAAVPGETSGTVRSRAIPAAGTYEVRYVTGLQHQVLARDTIVVTE